MTEQEILNNYKKYDSLNKDKEHPLIRVLVSYIKPSFLFKSKILTPIHLGRAVEKVDSKDGGQSDENLKWLHENCEFNDDFDGGISQHNRRIGFFTGTYWAWKNYEKLGNPEYFGSFGYRKLLIPESFEYLKDYDFLIPETLTLRVMSNKKNFIDCNTENLFLCMVEIFNARYPEEMSLFDEYLNLPYGYYHELYIMKKEYFFDFCSWIFPLIQDCLSNPRCHKVRTVSEKIRIQDFFYLNDDRDIAFIAEMFTGFYLWKMKRLNQAKFLECKFIETEKEQEKKKVVQGFVSFLKKRITTNKTKEATMIPKRIFYVWGYGEAKSKLANICIENWRDKLPDFEIIELNEKAKEWFDFDYEYEHNKWFKTVYDLKMWAYVADYMRVKAVHDHGGVYFDTDVTAYKDFTPLLNHKMFIGNCLNNIPEMAVFGAEAGHPILKAMLDFYQDEIWKSPDFIITKIFKNKLSSIYGLEPSLDKVVENADITIYPPRYFNPFHFDIEFKHECITPDTYSVHWMGASWHSKKNLFFLSNKHRLPLNTLLKQLDFIERTDKNANEKIKMPA